MACRSCFISSEISLFEAPRSRAFASFSLQLAEALLGCRQAAAVFDPKGDMPELLDCAGDGRARLAAPQPVQNAS